MKNKKDTMDLVLSLQCALQPCKSEEHEFEHSEPSVMNLRTHIRSPRARVARKHTPNPDYAPISASTYFTQAAEVMTVLRKPNVLAFYLRFRVRLGG